MSLWRAIYLDDTTLYQKMEGQEISSEAIDRTRIKRIELLTDNNDVVVTLDIEQGQNFFYRRRNRLIDGGHQICHVLGKLCKGMVDGPVIFHFDEGAVEYTNGFDMSHPWFYPVNFRPCELQ